MDRGDEEAGDCVGAREVICESGLSEVGVAMVGREGIGLGVGERDITAVVGGLDRAVGEAVTDGVGVSTVGAKEDLSR